MCTNSEYTALLASLRGCSPQRLQDVSIVRALAENAQKTLYARKRMSTVARHLQEETAEKTILPKRQEKRQQEQQQGMPAETGFQAQPHAGFKPQRQGEVPDEWPMFSEAAASRQEQRETDWPSIEPMVTSGPERYTSESSCQLVA